jgi:hypothetical protein
MVILQGDSKKRFLSLYRLDKIIDLTLFKWPSKGLINLLCTPFRFYFARDSFQGELELVERPVRRIKYSQSIEQGGIALGTGAFCLVFEDVKEAVHAGDFIEDSLAICIAVLDLEEILYDLLRELQDCNNPSSDVESVAHTASPERSNGRERGMIHVERVAKHSKVAQPEIKLGHGPGT